MFFESLLEFEKLSKDQKFKQYVFEDYQQYMTTPMNEFPTNGNGVSKEFLDKYYDGDVDKWFLDNIDNEKCFNCYNSHHLVKCRNCRNCKYCLMCEYCENCVQLKDSDNCSWCSAYRDLHGRYTQPTGEYAKRFERWWCDTNLEEIN